MTQERLHVDYLFADPPRDPDAAPADYDMLCFECCGAELYGEIMWPDGSFGGRRPCVILAHGYPGVARNDDLAFALRRIGCVVVTVHHRGAWGSQGKYLVSNCVQDIVALCAHVRSPDFCRTYRTDPDALFLVGHSMGGNSVLQAARQVKGVRGLVLLAPYDPTRLLREGDEAGVMPLLRTGYILRCDGLDAILRDMQARSFLLLCACVLEQRKRDGFSTKFDVFHNANLNWQTTFSYYDMLLMRRCCYAKI